MKSVLAVIASLAAVVSCQYGYGNPGPVVPEPESGSPVCEPSYQFAVANFSAGCVSHGTGCSFQFAISTNESTEQVSCDASFPTTSQVLPAVPFRNCSSATPTNVVWGFAPVGLNGSVSNYTLLVADATLGLAAAKIWDAAAFPVEKDGSTVNQQYTGPTDFEV